MGVDEVALWEDLLADGTQASCLIRTHYPGTVPVFADTYRDAVRLDGGLEVDQVVDEIVSIVHVAYWFCAELDAMKDVRCDVLVRAGGEDLEDRCSDLLPVFELVAG